MKVVWALLQANLILIWNHFKDLHSTFPASSLAFAFLYYALQPYLLNFLKLCPWSTRDTMLLFFLETSIPLFPLQKPYPTNLNFLYSGKPFSNPASSQNPPLPLFASYYFVTHLTALPNLTSSKICPHPPLPLSPPYEQFEVRDIVLLSRKQSLP